jgi:hypothetical protein
MILQTRFKNGYEVNISLGTEYHVVDKERSPDPFAECVKECFGENAKDFVDICYLFIVARNEHGTIALYRGHENYILNDNGGLFNNMTYK